MTSAHKKVSKAPKKKIALKKKFSAADLVAEESRYLVRTYRRPPMVFTHGRGCRLFDSTGRSYLDFLAGIAVNALGYAHPRIVRTIRRQAGRVTHISNLFHNPFQAPLARKLAEWSGLDRVFFSNSGTEAMEGALKLARAYAHAKGIEAKAAPRTRILALENSFHGRTFGALSITHTPKYREPFAPLVPGVEFVRFNDVADLDAKFDSTVCAIVVEPIQGEGGVYPLSEAFWERARQLTLDHDAALIADEIQTGLGRTGRAFAYQKFESVPDIVTVAKSLAGGLPLGAFIANEKFASAFSPGMHGTTFGGGPLACATALEFLTIVEEQHLFEKVRARGAQLRAGLEKLASRYEFIREIRGEGLIIGLDLSIEGGPFVEEALRAGLLINCTHDHVLRLLPPFILRRSDVAEFLKKFDGVLARAAKPAGAVRKTMVSAAASKIPARSRALAVAASR